MERRKALAWSAVGALMVASGTVVVTSGLLEGGQEAASGQGVTSSSLLERPSSTTSLQPVVVTETKDVFDTVVVPVDPTVGAAGPVTVAPTPPPPTSAAPPRAPVPTSPPTSAPPPPTTAPRGDRDRSPEIPDDWPEDKPLPPIPDGCEEPHLEDDGVWNCQH